jgi:hypothetical protein
MTLCRWLIAFPLLPSTCNLWPFALSLYPWSFYLLLFSFFRLQALLQVRVALSDGTVSGIPRSFGKSIETQISLGGVSVCPMEDESGAGGLVRDQQTK